MHAPQSQRNTLAQGQRACFAISTMTTKQKALRNLGIFALLFIALGIFMSWTNARFHVRAATPAEQSEAGRQQATEDARAKNYVENIKPHVAR
jgi:hypothetical protein